jgi:SAM-dependent methyltransferase
MAVTNIPTRAWNKLRQTSNRLARWTHARLANGDAVDCVLCEWQGSSFFKGHCPRCNSRARTRLMPYAMEYFGIISTGKVLFHLGPNKPETAWIARAMKPKVHICADILKFPITNLICDATRLPLSESSVDLVITWHVLEHIADDRVVMRELFRALRPGGKVLMSVPIVPPHRPATFEDRAVPREKFLEVFGHEDHVRACGLDYGDRFVAEGFKMHRLVVKDLEHSDRQEDLHRFGLSTGHVVWCFHKP